MRGAPSAKRLDLVLHVGGLPGVHPAGVETPLLLGEFLLEEPELTFGLVEGQFRLLELGILRFEPGGDSLRRVVGRPVLLQLGKALSAMQQPVDIGVDRLQIEQVGQTAQFLHQPRSLQGVGSRWVRSIAPGSIDRMAAYSALIPGRSVAV